MIKIKILNKIPKLNLKDVIKLHNREYSIFTMSSWQLTFKEINDKWVKGCFGSVIIFYSKGIATMFRNQFEEDNYEKSMAQIITSQPDARKKIVNNLDLYAKKLVNIFKEIDKGKNFSAQFVKRFNSTFGHFCIYVMAVHRGIDYIKDIPKHKKIKNLLIEKRVSYEHLMGDYDKYLDKLCAKIAVNLNIKTAGLLKLMTFDEFIAFLNRGKLPKNLSKRYYSSILILLPKYCLLVGKPASSLFRKLQEQHDKIHHSLFGNKAIKGTPVYSKVVQGKVQVIIDPKDFVKLKKRNILVTITTLPKYTHVIKRAKGIIADEGGLLSHAAIVAREFHIPCVIGTKIATKVFKDGDLVEVDANKGVVRKIK